MHTTPPTLLERVRQPGDEAAWSRLLDLYAPLLYGWARRQGIAEADAADLVQEVFVTLLQTLPSFQYDQRHGHFRNWLRTLLLNKLRDRKRRATREEKALAHLEPAQEAPDPALLFWEAEYQREVTGRALRMLETDFAPSTWKAFWETLVEGRPAAEVARELGLTANAVCIARCRVLRRLREELGDLID
jgi:RNA polymerase sigma-70 factor, ECF subfamily